MTDHKFRDVIYAHVTYDAQGRIANVDYPQAKDPNNAANYLRLAQAYDSYGKQNSQTYTLSNGQQATENYTRSGQTGALLQSSQTYNSQTNTWQYTYDAAGRLTNASLASTLLGSQNYAYNFALSDASCNGSAGLNTNAYKNANRSSQTITKNGVSSTTTYCYDQADRLVQTSDPLFSNPVYDTHGNTTQIGDSSNRLTLGYDAAGRNTSLTHGSSGQAGYANIAYSRDAQGRLAAKTETKADPNNPANNVSSTVKYGYTASGDSPNYLLNGNNQVTEAYLSLPGGALLSVQLDPSSGSNSNGTSNTTQDSTISQTGYILDNLHGDMLAHISNAGVLQDGATTQVYDPFGNRIDSVPTATPAPTGVSPQSNAYQWLGSHQKQSDVSLAQTPIQMGVRVYLPGLGRFLQPDPQDGGLENNYVYPPDPINTFDLTGTWGISFNDVLNAATVVTSAASLIPGPVGAVSMAANSACLYASGDKAGAAMAAAGVALTSVGGGAVVQAARVTKTVVAAQTVAKNMKFAESGAKLMKSPSKVTKFVQSGKNLLRINKNRIAFGPALSFYRPNGRLTAKIPWHFEINLREKTVFLEKHISRRRSGDILRIRW